MPGLHRDDLGHLCFHKQETDASEFLRFSVLSTVFTSRGGGGTSHVKRSGMLVVSLRGLNHEFWPRLGCSGGDVTTFK